MATPAHADFYLRTKIIQMYYTVYMTAEFRVSNFLLPHSQTLNRYNIKQVVKTTFCHASLQCRGNTKGIMFVQWKAQSKRWNQCEETGL